MSSGKRKEGHGNGGLSRVIRMGPLALDRTVKGQYEWRDGNLRKKRDEDTRGQKRKRDHDRGGRQQYGEEG